MNLTPNEYDKQSSDQKDVETWVEFAKVLREFDAQDHKIFKTSNPAKRIEDYVGT